MKMFHRTGLSHIHHDRAVHYWFVIWLLITEGKEQAWWPPSRSSGYFNVNAWMLLYVPESGGYLVSHHPYNRVFW